MVLSSRYALRPYSPIQRPIPEFLYPPNGTIGPNTLQQLRQIVPAFIFLVIYSASSKFYDIIPAPNPYWVSFALQITSSISLYLKMHCTGPKIYYFAMVILSETFVKIVGSMKNPLFPYLFPPVINVAPYYTPILMNLRIFSICFRLIWGPWLVFGSNGSPSFIFCTLLIIRSTNSSQISECTKTLVPATHTCPALKKVPLHAKLTAFSRSAFLVIICGDFPPSSRVILFKLLTWECFMISIPTFNEPVNDTLSIFGWRAKYAPISPYPETILTTPLGIPASLMSYATLRAESGVCSAVFITTVQPAAKAGASLYACIIKGTFQGIICPTIPTGSFLVDKLNGPSILIVFPRILSTHPAQYRYIPWVSQTSIDFASLKDFPLFVAQIVANSSVFCQIRSASLKRHLARSVGSIRFHGPLQNAFFADYIAKSMSSFVPFYTYVMMDSSTGFMTLNV